MDRKKLVSLLAAIMAGIMLLSLLLGLLVTTVSAASSSEIQNQIDQLEQEKAVVDAEIAELQKILADNAADMATMIAQKNAIDQQYALLVKQTDTITQMVSAYNLMIADQQEDLDAAEARLEELNEKYKARIRVMEEQGSLSYWSVIFNASSFADLLDRLNMVAEIANADAKRLEELKAVAEEVTAARQELVERKREMESTKLELQASQEEMQTKRAESDRLLADLVALGQEYEAYMMESERLQHELMEELAQKEKEYDDAQYKEWLATSVPPTTTGPVKDRVTNTVNGIVWVTPTKNFWVSSPFGWRDNPLRPGTKEYHLGIDLAAYEGTPVYATRAGFVTITAYQEGGAGNYVKINHGDGYGSIYMHMTHYIVKVGEYVSAGQIIGYVGTTGGSTGPHLHFGISYYGEYVDPAKYIKLY